MLPRFAWVASGIPWLTVVVATPDAQAYNRTATSDPGMNPQNLAGGPSMRIAIAATILSLAHASTALAPVTPAVGGPKSSVIEQQRLRAATESSTPVCAMDLLHPIDVTVRLDDAMVPGVWLRASVALTSREDLAEIQVEFLPAAAVELGGSRKATLPHIAAGEREEISFLVRVPDTQAPLQVQVRVVGKADAGMLERGAVLHLLPRGPEHPGVESAVPSGQHRVLEYRGAGRRAQ
jgi:uncharacterized protein YwbE